MYHITNALFTKVIFFLKKNLLKISSEVGQLLIWKFEVGTYFGAKFEWYKAIKIYIVW